MGRITRSHFALGAAALGTVGAATPLLGAVATNQAAPAQGRLSVGLTPSGPLLTPVDEMFVYSQMRTPASPALTPTSGTIAVDGLVRNTKSFSYGDLRGMPTEKRLLTLECFVNTAGGPLIFTTPFEGVPLATLMDTVGVREDAVSAVIETADGHPPFALPLSELRRKSVMLVSRMGDSVPAMKHGGAYARLMIPGAGGNHHPKWVRRISFGDKKAPEHPAPAMAGFLDPAPPEAQIGAQGGVLTGYAFVGPEPVGTIEISTDGGATYQAFPALPQPDPYVWITWRLHWVPPQPGFYVLRVRATSASGRQQDTPGVLAIEVRAR